MSDYESVSSNDWDEEELELHTEDSSEGSAATTAAYKPESEDDFEEDGFDVGTHGGGSLENVAEFDGSYALTEGFTILDEGEAIDLATVPPACDETYDQPESVCGRDDRKKISGTTSIPWRMICKLIITTAGGSRSGCTGWFIGPRTVMTAGHCVYSHTRGGWAKKIEVIPGMNGTVKPYGSQIGTSFRSVTGWTKSKKSTHDYGCIILPNDTLGRRVGWFGFANLSAASLRNLLANNSGYAGDKPFGTQWYNAGRISKVEARRLHYMLDTFGGQSGSPTWRYRDGKRHAIGIHAYGGCPNKSTRITKPVFNNMKNWKNV
ncbi:serine protease [Desulfogranum marinum]|uniref:trypsin-like serine peptidase n=1 Tax=Desulfogranum marinum TaxID=453220 RepID=UPI0029C77B6A|nr:serine protease [Desulfogranum marinum]